MSEKLKGKFTISKSIYGSGKTEMHLELIDESSHIRFCEMAIDLRVFMEALTGAANQEMIFELRGLDKIGKTHESESITIHIPNAKGVYKDSEFLELARPAAKEFEVDGWSVYDHDLQHNHHKMKCDGDTVILQSVRHRYV